MKKNIPSICFLLLLTNFIHSQDGQAELSKRTIMLLPVFNESKIENYDYLSNVIRDALRSELELKKNFRFIEYQEIDKNLALYKYLKDDIFQESKALALSIYLKADIYIFCKFNINDEKLVIELDVFDVLTGYKVIGIKSDEKMGSGIFKLIDDISQNSAAEMSEKLSMLKKNYLEKKMNEQEDMLRKMDEDEIKRHMYDKKYILTIGGAFYPLVYEYKSGESYKDADKNIEYFSGGINLIKFGISLPFSFSYYFNKYCSIGFVIQTGYSFGAGNFIDSKAVNSFNDFFNNLSIKHRFGRMDSHFSFILEYGAILEFEFFSLKEPEISYDNFTSARRIRYYDGSFMGIGPRIWLGLEIRSGNFSYESGFFIGSSFGCGGKDDYRLDINLPVYNFVVTGIEMRFNYYHPFDVVK
jgi:hypothetical protein